MAQCALCLSIADAIQSETSTYKEHVWEYHEFQRNTECVTCQKIVRILEPQRGCELMGDVLGVLEPEGSPEGVTWAMRLGTRNIEADMRSYVLFMIDTATSSALGFYPLEREISAEGLKGWVSHCDEYHSGKCHSNEGLWTKIPYATGLIFIDVEKMCLVKQPTESNEYRYVALSYVWGATTDPFHTVKANFEALSQDNAFELPYNRSRLPNTIADSISITRILGVRYLWVDRFSIVQDDEITKPHQLSSMASIYSNAYLTIAATEGDSSDYGLPGIMKERSRVPPFEEFQFAPDCHFIEADTTRRSLSGTYHTRGWTFQEWTFSRRTLVFHHQTVSWVCEYMRQGETGSYPSAIPVKPTKALWIKHPKPTDYCVAVETYSQRNLTHPDDIIAAFKAFMTVQGRAMKGDNMFGIPELFFNSMLCWHHGEGSLQQRRAGPLGSILKDFPSWSWVGWLGSIDMSLPRYASTTRVVKHASDCLTYPHLIEFYNLVIEPHGVRRGHVRDLNYYKTRGLAHVFEEEYDSWYLGTRVTSVYPAVEDDEIWSLVDEHTYSTIIEFRTHRLFVSLSEHDRDDMSRNTPLITDTEGQMIGILDLDISLANLQLPKHNVELICISMSIPVCVKHAHLRTPGTRYLSETCRRSECFADISYFFSGVYAPASNWQFTCYDVLWIEWEDGVAYRKAIGQVWKEDWEAADTEEVDIRLG